MLVLTGMLIAVFSGDLAHYTKFVQRFETTSRLKDLRVSFEKAYREQMSAVEAVATATFTTSDGVLTNQIPSVVTNLCASSATTLNAVGRYLPDAPTKMMQDAFNRPLCFFITTRQTISIDGIPATFRSIAIVSAGVDGRIDLTTALSATGALTLGGDDEGVVVDGRFLTANQYKETAQKMAKIVQALQTMFQSRYLSNLSRDPSVDYFVNSTPAGTASPRYASGSPIVTTGGAAVTMTSINAHTALGLSTDDVTDGFGQTINIDNSSNDVRHPDNGAPAQTTPPFTTRISTTLPNGQVFSLTAVGAF